MPSTLARDRRHNRNGPWDHPSAFPHKPGAPRYVIAYRGALPHFLHSLLGYFLLHQRHASGLHMPLLCTGCDQPVQVGPARQAGGMEFYAPVRASLKFLRWQRDHLPSQHVYNLDLHLRILRQVKLDSCDRIERVRIVAMQRKLRRKLCALFYPVTVCTGTISPFRSTPRIVRSFRIPDRFSTSVCPPYPYRSSS